MLCTRMYSYIQMGHSLTYKTGKSMQWLLLLIISIIENISVKKMVCAYISMANNIAARCILLNFVELHAYKYQQNVHVDCDRK